MTSILTFNVCRFATARSAPQPDPSQDISAAMATLENGVTTVNFTRPCNSSESADISLGQCPFLLYAYGGTVDSDGGPVDVATRTITYHSNNRGVLSPDRVCFPCGNCQAPTSPPTGTYYISYAVLLCTCLST